MLQKIGIRKCNSNDLKYFKSSYTNEKVKLSKDMADIDHIVSFMIEPIVKSYRIINSINSKATEGTNLTGKYIQLDILFKEKVIYSSSKSNDDLSYLEISYMEVCSIVVPDKIEGTDIVYLMNMNRLPYNIYIEDVSIQLFNSKEVIINVYYMAELKYIPTYELVYISKEDLNRNSIYISYNDGSKQSEKLSIRKFRCVKPKWSENGTDISFLSNEKGKYLIYLLDSKMGSVRCLIDCYQFNKIIDYVWKDANTIIFSGTTEETTDIFSLDCRSKRVKRITISPEAIKNYKVRYSKDRDSVAFIRSSKEGKVLSEIKLNGDNYSRISNIQNIKDFCWTYKSRYIAALCEYEKNIESLSLIDMEFKDESEIQIPDKYSNIKKLSPSPCEDIFAFIGTNIEEKKDDIFIYLIKKRKMIKLTNHIGNVNISSITWKVDGSMIYFASNELGYYNIFSLDINNFTKKHIVAANSVYLEIDYRPSNN